MQLKVTRDPDYPEKSGFRISIGDGYALLVVSSLGDIQYVIKELAPGKSAKLFWEPVAIPGEPLPTPEPISEDFCMLTPERMRNLPRHRYQLQIERIKEPLFLIGTYADQKLEGLFGVHKFAFSGTSPEVEKAVDLIGQLFEKNPLSDYYKPFQ